MSATIEVYSKSHYFPPSLFYHSNPTPSPRTWFFPQLHDWLSCSPLPLSVSSQVKMSPWKMKLIAFTFLLKHRTSLLTSLWRKAEVLILIDRLHKIWPLLLFLILSLTILCFVFSTPVRLSSLFLKRSCCALCLGAHLIFIWMPDLLNFRFLLLSH